MLKGLLKQIEELEGSKELSTPGGRTLKQQIKSHLDTEDEWMFFKHHFEEVHPDFFKKLCSIHPNLSENEGRYRIRKKMQLGQDVTLENYLRDI